MRGSGAAQREQDDDGYGYRREGKGERVVPREGSQETADRGVARRPYRENAGIVSERARPLAAFVDVPDHRDVESPEGGGSHALKKSESEEQFEAAGEGAGAAGEAEKDKGGDQDLLPPETVGEYAEERSQHDAGHGEERDQEPNLPTRDPERPHDAWKGRSYARGP